MKPTELFKKFLVASPVHNMKMDGLVSEFKEMHHLLVTIESKGGLYSGK